jgi:hypothetical protein
MRIERVEPAVAGKAAVPDGRTARCLKPRRQCVDLIDQERRMRLASRGEGDSNADVQLIARSAKPHAASSRQLAGFVHLVKSQETTVEVADLWFATLGAADLHMVQRPHVMRRAHAFCPTTNTRRNGSTVPKSWAGYAFCKAALYAATKSGRCSSESA